MYASVTVATVSPSSTYTCLAVLVLGLEVLVEHFGVHRGEERRDRRLRDLRHAAEDRSVRGGRVEGVEPDDHRPRLRLLALRRLLHQGPVDARLGEVLVRRE